MSSCFFSTRSATAASAEAALLPSKPRTTTRLAWAAAAPAARARRKAAAVAAARAACAARAARAGVDLFPAETLDLEFGWCIGRRLPAWGVGAAGRRRLAGVL